MAILALIPPALAVLHNFIWQYDPKEIHKFDDTVAIKLKMGPHESARELWAGHVMPNKTLQANERAGGSNGGMNGVEDNDGTGRAGGGSMNRVEDDADQ
ncbi:hypothetical protein BJV74DRAFT_891305 [Russula compacta]|nr:hypothetical protein BJV74DRAFT_891305 [Russula compacta]